MFNQFGDEPSPHQEFKKQLRRLNDEYNERIKQLIAGDFSNKQPLRIGLPSPCLLQCGFPNLPIEISVRTLMDKINQDNHPYSLVSVVHMPECICNPIAVFQSISHIDSKVVLTEMIDDYGYNLVVAIKMGDAKSGKAFNSIRSVYPKDSVNGVFSWITGDLMEYCDKEKALDWVGKQPSNPADVTKHIEGHTNIIKKVA